MCNKPVFGPAYAIRTNRLLLRCYNPADAPLLMSSVCESRDHLLPWMPWAENYPMSHEQVVGFLRNWRGLFDLGKDFCYGVFDPDEKRLLGSSGLHNRVGDRAREIGYWIHKDFTRQGLATEVSAALTKVAFTIDEVDRVEIHCDLRNLTSAAIPRRLGFTHEATRRQLSVAVGEGPRGDNMIWTLLAAEFAASPCAKAEIVSYDATGRKIN